MQFQEAEKKRYRAEQQRFETKHQRQLEECRASAQSAVKELEQMQNEKRKMLMEHETLKLKELDEAYSSEVREWKAQLKPRKQVRMAISYYSNVVRAYYCPIVSLYLLLLHLLPSFWLSVLRRAALRRARRARALLSKPACSRRGRRKRRGRRPRQTRMGLHTAQPQRRMRTRRSRCRQRAIFPRRPRWQRADRG